MPDRKPFSFGVRGGRHNREKPDGSGKTARRSAAAWLAIGNAGPAVGLARGRAPACRPQALQRILFAVSTATMLRLAVWASIAALAAALGPFLLGSRPAGRPAHLGISSALAAGAMLGVGYALMSVGLARAGLAATLGAVLGVATSFATHLWLGLGADDHVLRPGRAVAASAVHAAPEGIAMGAAMAVDVRFGLFLVATLAVHNVWESEVLGSLLLAQGGRRSTAAVLGILTNGPQVLLAVAGFALAVHVPGAGPLLLGFGFGALTYLCLAELLPESYRSTGRTSIAVVVSVAAGVVALLGGSIT